MEANTMNPDQTAPKELSDWGQYCLQYRPLKYCKISITGPCSNRGPFPSLDAKMPIFQANFPKNRASNKGPPANIEKLPVQPYAETSQICY